LVNWSKISSKSLYGWPRYRYVANCSLALYFLTVRNGGLGSRDYKRIRIATSKIKILHSFLAHTQPYGDFYSFIGQSSVDQTVLLATNHVSYAVVGASVPRIQVYGSVTRPRTVTETHVQRTHACANQQQQQHSKFLCTDSSHSLAAVLLHSAALLEELGDRAKSCNFPIYNSCKFPIAKITNAEYFNFALNSHN